MAFRNPCANLTLSKTDKDGAEVVHLYVWHILSSVMLPNLQIRGSKKVLPR